ncbi:ABC transporter permease [Pseudokineococcus sp. 5B2Z-1]|uniref:ABC transporter permease n=1 Tax=Pseudokineococcus sp. 5B2Z-1 TaxID=3132744 RepID=UPI0030B79DEE
MTATPHARPAPRRALAPAALRGSLLGRAWPLRRSRIGWALVLLVLLVAFVGPYLAPFSPTEFVGAPYTADVAGTLLGTDDLGRDVLTRFLHGGRWLLALAAAATVLGVGVGAAVGLLAGYRRGVLDEVLMRSSDVLLAFPQVVIALLFLAALGPQKWLLVLLVAVGHAPRVARVVRGAALSVVGRDFVEASESAGTPVRTILRREVLPNVTGTLMVELGLRLTYSIGILAGLSFLGLGLQPPAADWGLMINQNRIALTVQPWSVVLPVAAIAVLTIGTNLITDGLARASAGLDQGVQS